MIASVTMNEGIRKSVTIRPENSPEALEEVTGVLPATLREAARCYASASNGAIYYGLGVTEHSQGSTMVMAMAMAGGAFGQSW